MSTNDQNTPTATEIEKTTPAVEDSNKRDSLDNSNSPPTEASSGTNTTDKGALLKQTPQAIRTRRNVQEQLHMSSPSDSMLSPCTSKLFGKGGKKAVSGPTAILRNKQQSTIPFDLNDEQ